MGSKLSSSSSIERGTKSGAMMGISLYRNENRATLFPSFRKAWLSARPEISESRTSGSTWRSRVKFFPAASHRSGSRSCRSISILPMAFDTHSAAFGSVGFEKDFGRRLREHDLRQMAVDDLKLGLALKAKHERILALSVLGDGGMELRKPL